MRIRTLLVGLFVTFFAATTIVPIPVQADDAQSLLAKHRAFVGWQYGDGSVASLYLERIYTDAAGKVTQHATEKRLGLAYRRDYQSSATYGEGGSTGFTGRVFWKTTENGFTVPLIGDTAKFYLAVDVLFMEGTPELPAAVQGTATVDGKSVTILRVTMNGAVPFDVYEDPQTGAYVRAVIDPGGQQESTYNILSYADLAPGKKLIGSWSLGVDKGVYSYAKTRSNVALGPDDLHPPSPAATWSFANGQPFPIRVTDARLYVDATVNGVPGRFFIDTGSGDIALTDDFANRAHVKTVDRSTGFGIGGEAKTLVRKADTITIGGNTLSNVIVSSLNMSLEDKQNYENADGLIGFDLFAGAIIDMNLSAHSMRISDPANAADGHGGYQMTPDLSDGVPVVPAKVNDKLAINAVLDTGGLDMVVLSNQVENHGVHLIVNQDNTFLNGNMRASGVAGDEMMRCGPLSRIAVGPFTYTGLEACESPNWALSQGLVGFDFLKHFDYVFDYPHGVMYMIPHKE
jgi:predicted aspartyl protease